PVLTAGVLLGLSGRSGAEEDPWAPIRRAVQAVGGGAKLAQAKAVQLKIKGTIRPVSGGTLPFTAHTSSQFPGPFPHVMDYRDDRDGSMVNQIQIYNGEQVGIEINGLPRSLDDDLRVALRKGRYADELTQLLFLKEKANYQLALLTEAAPVQGRAVVGVK